MKKLSPISSILAICFIVLATSCEIIDISNQSEDGSLEFMIQNSKLTFVDNLKSEGISESNLDSLSIRSIVISIEDKSGKGIYDRKRIELLSMNSYFISSPISLPVGEYKLTEFFVVDDSNNIIYVSPVKGAPKSHLVDKPLPTKFEIKSNEVLKMVPEVLSVENSTPEDFGYTTFSFEVVEYFEILLSVFVFNEENRDFELTTARISISSEDELLYSGKLRAETNLLYIKDNFASYELKIGKEGFRNYYYLFSADSLKFYDTRNHNGPLMIILKETSDPHFGNRLYGLGSVEDYLIFGSIDFKGNEKVHFNLEHDQSYTKMWSLLDDVNKHYIYSAAGKYGSNDLIRVIDMRDGHLVRSIQTNRLQVSTMTHSNRSKSFHGIGTEEDYIVFGSIDYSGNEIILKKHYHLPNAYGGWSLYDKANNYYIFASSSGVTNIEHLEVVDAASGKIVHSIRPNKLHVPTFAYSTKNEKYYGLGEGNHKVVFGTIDNDGNEEIISTFEDIDSYTQSWSLFDDKNNRFIFGRVFDNEDQGNIWIIDAKSGEIVTSFETDLLHLGALNF